MKLRFIIIVILLLGCKSTKIVEPNLNDTIVYIFPPKVENALKEYLSDKDSNSICMELRKDEDSFSLYINDSDIFWKSRTNRKAVIDKKFYPLIFGFDSTFGSAEDAEIVLNRLKHESKNNPFTRKELINIYDNVFMVKFKENGEILHKGSSW